MELSAELFKQIRDALTSTAGDAKEKRNSARVSLSVQVKLMLLPSRTTYSARVKDISSGGLGLLGETALAVGQRFIVHLRSAHQNPMALLGEVRHVRSPNRLHFVMGATFLEILDLNNVRAQAAPPTAAAT